MFIVRQNVKLYFLAKIIEQFKLLWIVMEFQTQYEKWNPMQKTSLQ